MEAQGVIYSEAVSAENEILEWKQLFSHNSTVTNVKL